MSESKIIIEVADGFRKEDNEKTHSISGLGTYEVRAIPNREGETFYRGHLFKTDKKVGITAPRFVPSLFGEAHKEREKVAKLGEALTRTDTASPYVSMTTDYRIAFKFLKTRMEQTGITEGYITEIKPNSYLDTRNVLMGARDSNTEHGMNKNKEVVVAGRVEPKEIKSSKKITNIQEYEQSPKHKKAVKKEILKDEIREMRQTMNND